MIEILNSEEEYRKYPALSYSKLKMADTEPWNIPKEKLPPGQAMLFGSAIDVMLQPGNRFEEEFVVLDTTLPDKTTVFGKLVNTLWVMQDMSKEAVEIALNSVGAKQLKPEKALLEIEPWKEKFELLKAANESGKKIISTEQHSEALQVVNTLVAHPWCYDYFQFNPDIETLYQVPLVFEVSGYKYKTLPDLIVINHAEKTVKAVDIKHTEKLSEFRKSYLDYRYDIQECLHEMGTMFYIQEKYPTYKILSTEFLVCSKNSYGKILRFYTHQLNPFDRFGNGWTTRYGRELRSIKQLTSDLEWYEANGYSEKRELVENKGLIKLEI